MPKMKIRDMLRDAEDAARNATSPEDTAKAEARVAFLREMQDAGFTVNQDGINDVVAAETGRVQSEWQSVVGCDLEETRSMIDSLTDEDLERFATEPKEGGEPGGDSEANVLRLMRQGLSERDARIEQLDSSLGDFRTRYAEERVGNALNDAFRREGLAEKFLPAARRLSDFSDLVAKSAKGDEVSADELEAKVSAVRDLSGVWFGDGASPESDPRALPGGFRLKPEAVRGIPPTPNGRSAAQISDADREARASSIY